MNFSIDLPMTPLDKARVHRCLGKYLKADIAGKQVYLCITEYRVHNEHCVFQGDVLPSYADIKEDEIFRFDN